MSSQIPQVQMSLTCLWNVVLKSAVPGLANHYLVRQGRMDSTHHTTTRTDTLSESTCSALSVQKGRALLQGWTYHNENRKHCNIVNTRHTASNSARVPHDFSPCQAYAIFHEGDDKLGEGKHQWHGLPRPPGSRRSHRKGWRWPQSNNTSLNRSFSAAEPMKTDAYPRCDPGDFGVRGSGPSISEGDKGRGLTAHSRSR
jgi:hypothetical protein